LIPKAVGWFGNTVKPGGRLGNETVSVDTPTSPLRIAVIVIPCGAPPCCAVMDDGKIREKSSEGGGGGGGVVEVDPPPPQAAKKTRNRTEVAILQHDTPRANEWG
jgi:hypothetical protein